MVDFRSLVRLLTFLSLPATVYVGASDAGTTVTVSSPAPPSVQSSVSRPSSAENLIPYRKGNKWGFSDLRRKLIIAPQYDDAQRFADGLATVMMNGKYGFINTSGRVVIPFTYDYPASFSEGYAAVSVKDKYGYIDKTGKTVVPFKYDLSEPFHEGLAKVTVGEKSGFIDKTGKELTPLKYDTVGRFHEGFAAVRVGNGASGKCGYIDKASREVIPLKYYACNEFSEGLAHVRLPDASGHILDGFIDKSGAVALPFSRDYYVVFDFHEGLLAVNDHYEDKNGRTVLKPGHDYLGEFSEGLAMVKINGKLGFIDKSGRLVIPVQFQDPGLKTCSLFSEFREGFAAVMLNGNCGFIDKTGKPITPFKYAFVDRFDRGLAYVQLTKDGGEDGYIGRDGTEYFEP